MERQNSLNVQSPSSTDNNTNNNDISVPKLCIADCGFFGNAANDWYCSKCYKAKQQKTHTAAVAPAPQPATAVSAATTTPAPIDTSAERQPAATSTLKHATSFNDVTAMLQTIQRSATPIPLEVLSPTVLPVSQSAQLDAAVANNAQSFVTPAAVVPQAVEPVAAQPTNSFKKVKCLVCSKKLGALSYQTCRCSMDENGVQIAGRVFCNEHRHAFSHECTFDIKKLQKTVLSAANPEIKGNKLERI